MAIGCDTSGSDANSTARKPAGSVIPFTRFSAGVGSSPGRCVFVAFDEAVGEAAATTLGASNHTAHALAHTASHAPTIDRVCSMKASVRTLPNE